MPDRRGSTAIETDRPDGSTRPQDALSGLLTVADVLALPVVAEAAPEVLSGGASLGGIVRWVHVSDSTDAPDLLDGGELLLSTGAGWPDDPDRLGDFAARLAGVPIAGLVLELGVRFSEPPQALATACAEHGIPLIVLHRVVKFVAVTEAVHSRIILEQAEALRVRDRLNQLFIGLSLRGSAPEYIVSQLAQVLRAPVVLEDLAHRVVAVETLDAGDEVLAGWESTSRGLDAASGWSVVPVEARGRRWGSLIALPGEPHTAGREQVMQQAAIALAIGRLADGDADEWTRRSHEQILRDLVGARYSSPAALAARFEAAGLPVTGRELVAIAVRPSSGSLDPVAEVRDVARALGAPVVVAPHPFGLTVAVLSFDRGALMTDLSLERAARSLAPAGAPVDAVLAVGSGVRSAPELLASIDEAVALVQASSGERPGRVQVIRASQRPLLRFITALADDPRVQEHSERMLRPLIEHDLAHDGDLLDVLRAYASHPGNRTRAAAASHLSRSVFYQRLALIEDLLGVDLDDGETVSALHAALLARRA